jgi:hypothetical protein
MKYSFSAYVEAYGNICFDLLQLSAYFCTKFPWEISVIPPSISLSVTNFGGECMKKIILTVVAILSLAAPLAYAGGSGCEDSSCREAGQSENQSLTGTTPELQQQPKGRARDASVDDFVTPGRAVEKDCDRDNCRESGKPQPEMRVPEKKCGTPNCD